MSGDRKTSEESDTEEKGGGEFDCLNCHLRGTVGMDHCQGCGTKYVWQDLSEMEGKAGDGDDDLSNDTQPLFDQKAVECGYLDVESGIFAFTGPTSPNKYQLSECQNCGTFLEVPAKSCPLCGGALKILTGNLAKLASGVISARGMTEEEMDASGGGVEDGDPRGEEFFNPLIRALPTENIVFAHLNVESGRLECLSMDGRPGPIDVGGEEILGEAAAVNIDTFERIRLMFEEQASTIIRLTSEAPLTASEICRRLGVPRSVCYRKLKMMTDAKLLSLCRDGLAPGEWAVSKYSSNIDMAYVSIEHGDMNMLIRLKDSKETMTQRFSSELK